MSVDRLSNIVNLAVLRLFAQIYGGRIPCESEATLQLHFGRIISIIADLEIKSLNETFLIELEKPYLNADGKQGRIDIWFRLTDIDGAEWRCAIELKFFKKSNHREPNNRYDVFKDIHRLENSKSVANIGFMLVATDHKHYIEHIGYSMDTKDFDFRDGEYYKSGFKMEYRTPKPYGTSIILKNDYEFKWTNKTSELSYLLLKITPNCE